MLILRMEMDLLESRTISIIVHKPPNQEDLMPPEELKASPSLKKRG
jgi:hypothetical protein